MPDTLSRLNKPCTCNDCSVSKFLDEIPADAVIMSITDINNSLSSITNMIWSDTNPGINSAVNQTLSNSLNAGIGAVPFGNKKVWKSLQLNDLDCKLAIDLLTSGNIPP